MPTLAPPAACILEHMHDGTQPAWVLQKAELVSEALQRNLRRAFAAGVKFAGGSDAGTPYNFHDNYAYELELMHTLLGMTPQQALHTATAVAAELIGMHRGTLAPGEPADILLLERDVSEDIRTFGSRRPCSRRAGAAEDPRIRLTDPPGPFLQAGGASRVAKDLGKHLRDETADDGVSTIAKARHRSRAPRQVPARPRARRRRDGRRLRGHAPQQEAFAIKMLHPELSIREDIRTRFLREGYVANSVEHPGAVAVLDDDVAEDGVAFLVMELLDGAARRRALAKHDGQRVPLALVLSIGDALLDVLVAAHAKGIVHRDIKPANLFLTSDGRAQGARLRHRAPARRDERAAQATQTGAMLGTPAFMAPEQALAESSKIDAQTDLLGRGGDALHAAHRGARARRARTRRSCSWPRRRRRRARSRASRRRCPRPVAEVIDRALAFDKNDRWASATAMREALAKACVERDGGADCAAAEDGARVTGLEATIASSPELDSGAGAAASSNVGFESHCGRAGCASERATRRRGRPVGPWRPRRRAPRERTGWFRGGRSRWGGRRAPCIAAGAGAVAMARRPQVAFCADIQTAIDGFRCVSAATRERRREARQGPRLAGDQPGGQDSARRARDIRRHAS